MKYHTKILHMPNDYEGKVIATITCANCAENGSAKSDKAVLYIHGYIDYFFHDHLAQAFVERGWNFYAVDLRKSGRSILPNQHPYYCRDITEYFPDLDKSIEVIIGERNKEIVLLGHSTGGLTASLYASYGIYREFITELILNSPFLDFNTPGFVKNVAIPAVTWIGKIFPYAHIPPQISSNYSVSLLDAMKGEWRYNTEWKPVEGFPTYLLWLRAVRRAHKEIRDGLYIRVPILIMHSDKSWQSNKWNDNYMHSDAVLNVKDIVKRGKRLGSKVTDIEIPGAMHDVFLSAKYIRDRAFEEMFTWLDGNPKKSSCGAESLKEEPVMA